MPASSFQPFASSTFLTDASVTKHPASDQVSEYVLPVESFLSANRVLTLGTTGSPATRQVVRVVRQDKQAFTYTVKDDLAATLYTFSATAPDTDTAASFYFDGTHWKFLSAYPVAGYNGDSRGANVEVDSTIDLFGEHGIHNYYRLTSQDDPSSGWITWTDPAAFGSTRFPDGSLLTFYNTMGGNVELPHMTGGYDATAYLPIISIDEETIIVPPNHLVTFRLDLDANSPDGAWVQVAHPRGVSETEWQKLTADRLPKAGTDLTDANQTLQPFTDKASQYTQAVALTASRNKTLGTTTLVTGTVVRIVREDTAAFTMPIINGGGSAGTLLTFAASPTERQAATFYYNGADWVLVGFEYLAS